MSVLLDTNILMPLIRKEEQKLGRDVRALLDHQTTALFFSVASLWEIAIKWRLKKLELLLPPATLPELLSGMGLSMLDVTADHALVEIDPAPVTRDPFDRLLLGVCAVEGMQLVTTDRVLQGHPLGWRAAN